MNSIYENAQYMADVKNVSEKLLPWNKIDNKIILISGATGMIGSFLVDVLMYRNNSMKIHTKVIALGRNEEKAVKRFSKWWGYKALQFVKHDINKPLTLQEVAHADYIIHLASNTHPIAYATDPIGTITANVLGTMYLLDYATDCNASRIAIASSNEIYGENRGDVELFDESYCGYINSNTMRAGYPESKRCAESLCQAYIKQKNLDVVIPRLTRTYGPTMLISDTKAISQFLKKGIAGEDIILKSEGNQFYSYTYVADAVSGLLTILLCGTCGEAYNIADRKSDITLKDLATLIAGYSGRKVVFELPDSVESAGYSKATKARLDNKKITKLGWEAQYDIARGITQTMDIMKDIRIL